MLHRNQSIERWVAKLVARIIACQKVYIKKGKNVLLSSKCEHYKIQIHPVCFGLYSVCEKKTF
jgi:hypothetical protein